MPRSDQPAVDGKRSGDPDHAAADEHDRAVEVKEDACGAHGPGDARLRRYLALAP
jgi:hypothetical protein